MIAGMGRRAGATASRGACMAGPVIHTYLVEAEAGVVVVVTNLLVSDIEALRARLRALNKPLLAILVTHPHPDHFNGVFGLVQDKEVPVYATASVARVIGEIAEAKREQWSPTYGAEWPAKTYYPNSPLADRAEVRFGELTFIVRELGPGESHADSYLLLSADGQRPVAFTGDLAFNGMHPYTADGHSAGWLAALDVLDGELADVGRLYPGHGVPAGPGLVAEQRRYLLYYRELVRRLADGQATVPEPARAELDRAMQAFLPGAPLGWMIGLGADPMADELAADPAAQRS